MDNNICLAVPAYLWLDIMQCSRTAVRARTMVCQAGDSRKTSLVLFAIKPIFSCAVVFSRRERDTCGWRLSDLQVKCRLSCYIE